MAETIEQWLNRCTRVVDEDGASTRKITLVTADGGTVWETWEGPFGSQQGGMPLADLAKEMTDCIDGLAEEWSKKRHTILLIALAADGTERSRHLKAVMGKVQGGSNAMMGGTHASVDTVLLSLAETMKTVLNIANANMNMIQAAREKDQEHIAGMQSLIIANKEKEMITVEQNSDSMSRLVDMLTENAGPLLELMTASKPAAAVRAVAPAVVGKGTIK
jgi:hypothetical protein